MHRFGPFEVDLATSELRRSGSRVRIQEQPLRILEILLEQPGEMVTRERLRDRLWPSDTFVDFERSLNAAVAKLRQTLHDSADHPVYVETVARKGYRFIAPISQTGDKPGNVAPTAVRAARSRLRVALLAGAVVVCAGAIVFLWAKFRRQDAFRDGGAMRFTVAMPEGTQLAGAAFVPNMAISPDGRTLAFVVSPPEGTESIWLRPLGSETARHLDGTEGAWLPFWSPDGREIGFFADGALKRVGASSGPVRVLCDSIEYPFGGSWGRGGVILYSAGGPLYTVNAAGGPCRELTHLDKPREVRHLWPHFLPDGRRFLFFMAMADPAKNAIYLASLENAQRNLVLTNRTRAAFAPPDNLLFVRNAILFAQKWDVERNRSRDQPVPVATDVNAFALGQSAFSVSENGVLVYRTAGNLENQVVCYSRDGKRLKNIGAKGAYRQLTLSPDEKTLALTVGGLPGQVTGLRIWLLRLDTEVISRYDFGNVANADPVWSPDSRRIVFTSYEVNDQKSDLLEWTIGEERPRLLLGDGRQNKPDDWSSDGRFLLYRRDDRLAVSVAMQPGSKPIAIVDRDFMKDQLKLSPDGTHVAYDAMTAGRAETFVAAFPSFTGTIQVSAEGGVEPLWSNDGKELFYLAPDRNLMSVQIRTGPPIETSAPRALFRTSLTGAFWGSEYAISRDGRKVYVLEPVSSPQDTLHVITRWDSE
ncbi:MAG TPA: winged helix-turn-helix domain-containing protein [Bryobacteraceae bacterium]|nr:winged helix-turn-helix domain-containing protein [Bryobacteraceae bacterium]